MDTAQTVFDRMVRAACGFESLHVRDGALDFLLSECASLICAFRSLFAERTEKRPEGTFSHVSADSTSPRDAILAELSTLTERAELWFMPSGQRTSGEDLRPELVLPGAARTGQKALKASPFKKSLRAQRFQ
jgi:hypothetical protein